MRSLLLALCGSALLTTGLRAADLRNFEDAALHAVQFCDDREGWAVGDEGVIWHTLDGGRTWERQPSGVRASLRSLHFLNPFVGWVVGREELPNGAGSTGVLLFTRDGGCKWQRVTMNAMPGLNHVCFPTPKVGYVVGDGADQYSTGAFVTRDAGRTWEPVPGPRCPGWFAADFLDAQNGTLVGSWNRLGTVRDGNVLPANVDTLGGRSLRGVFLSRNSQGKTQRGVAVGQGGLVLLTDNAGSKWSYPELRLRPEVLACWDLHTVHGAGGHLWAAGRPGSLLLHSGDDGRTWELQTTGHPLPLNGLYFHDAKRGWAVGELGTILATTDGGKTWKAQHEGGKRAALLLAHAHATGLPLGVVAQVGGEQGYLTTALRVLSSDSGSAAFRGASEGARWNQAHRQAGGAAAESLWQFPLATYLTDSPRADVLRAWDTLHGGRASEQLLRQLVLALRIWRPEVVVTDAPGESTPAGTLEQLLGEAMSEACKKAADKDAFPEQITQLGLQPWQVSKVYATTPRAKSGSMVIDLTEVSPRLEETLRDFTTAPAALLAEKAVIQPREEILTLLASRIQGAATHQSLMQGINDTGVGDCRRRLGALEPASAEVLKAIRTRASLQALSEQPIKGLTDPDRLLASIAPMLDQLPDSHGAQAAHALACQFVRLGEWHLAREAFMLLVERYPAHPLAADGYRWLIAHNASSETRRRHELGQFLVTTQVSYHVDRNGPAPGGPASPPTGAPHVEKPGKQEKPDRNSRNPKNKTEERELPEPRMGTGQQEKRFDLAKTQRAQQVGVAELSAKSIRQWHQGSLDLEPRLAAFGPLFANDPSLQFCLNAARRNMGDFDTPRQWCSDFVARQPNGPWRDAAAAELWLANRQGTAPRPVATCQLTSRRPYLDGKFDDPCWQGVKPIVLQDATGKTTRDSQTKVMLTYDREYLYVAIRCERATHTAVAPVKVRKRDADLRGFDRVSLMLDLDRDYATYFRFSIDERGCLHEDCWGDPRWNPRWFVARHQEAGAWQVEAAIPFTAMTGDTVTVGKAWACNVTRVLPGKGVQGFSIPAGVPEIDPRPEGMGLLLFTQDPQSATVATPGHRMQRVP